MKMNYRITTILVFGFAIAACGQQSATPALAPEPRPVDTSPTLAQTMQFIQEKLSEQGQVSWAKTISSEPGWTVREFVTISDVMADPATCTIYTTFNIDSIIDLPKGRTYKPGFTADDFRTHSVETDTTSFKQIEKITVEKKQDIDNQSLVEAAHPDTTETITPSVFYVKLWASSAVFTDHIATTKGKQAPIEKDFTRKTGGITIRDEETANKVAKAMTHAMELCGGGVTKKELF